MPSRRATGVLDAMTSDSVTVSWDSGLRSTLSLTRISRLEESHGRQRYVRRGIGLGLLGGAIAGATWGAIAYEKDAFLDFGAGPDMLGRGFALGAVGAVVGGIIGAQGRWERWSRFHPSRLSVEPRLGPRSHGLGVVVRF